MLLNAWSKRYFMGDKFFLTLIVGGTTYPVSGLSSTLALLSSGLEDLSCISDLRTTGERAVLIG